jgi:enterochelin esterase-like enzyme
VNDGELAFDGSGAMHMHRICEGLIRRGEIEPLIVVAVGNGGRRLVEYVPPLGNSWGGGDLYVRALRDSLKPEIDRRYRTLTDGRNTGIAGASLGGLISAYAGWAYDSTFGKIAAFSPSYGWTRLRFEDFARQRGRPSLLIRFYQDTGYPDDNGIGLMERVALELRFQIGIDFLSVTVPGGEHDYWAWQHRSPNMLRFLFPPKR